MVELNETIHQPVRLRIMAALVTLNAGEEVDFSYLRDLLQVTDGNLGAHLRKLEEAATSRSTRLSLSANRALTFPPLPGGAGCSKTTWRRWPWLRGS
jgi:hypothetical protein